MTEVGRRGEAGGVCERGGMRRGYWVEAEVKYILFPFTQTQTHVSGFFDWFSTSDSVMNHRPSGHISNTIF